MDAIIIVEGVKGKKTVNVIGGCALLYKFLWPKVGTIHCACKYYVSVVLYRSRGTYMCGI